MSEPFPPVVLTRNGDSRLNFFFFFLFLCGQRNYDLLFFRIRLICAFFFSRKFELKQSLCSYHVLDNYVHEKDIKRRNFDLTHK